MHLPSEPSFHHFKNRCICCEESNKEMNREHIFPQWLLKMTNTEQDMFFSPYGKVPGKTYTIPLCKECNSKLGSELEVPVSKIFRSIEGGNGFNDYDAELYKVNNGRVLPNGELIALYCGIVSPRRHITDVVGIGEELMRIIRSGELIPAIEDRIKVIKPDFKWIY